MPSRNREEWIAELRAQLPEVPSHLGEKRRMILDAIAALQCPDRTSYMGVRLTGRETKGGRDDELSE